MRESIDGAANSGQRHGQTPPQTNPRRAAASSLASRLFGASNGNVSVNPNLLDAQYHHALNTPLSLQQQHMQQQESYSRLRDHLFPSSSSSASVSATPTHHNLNSIPPRSSARSTASSRFQQMVQSAVLNSSSTITDRLASREFYQSLPQTQTPPPNVRRQTRSSASVAAMHPSFRSKAVCQLGCHFCSMDICGRGMRAILLADTSVELYSTDDVSKGRVQLVGEDYLTENCHCRIRDVACLGCGNVVGYHVTQPCELCLNSCNNGHFWMFLSDYVKAKERLDASGQKALVWAHLLDQAVADQTETVAR